MEIAVFLAHKNATPARGAADTASKVNPARALLASKQWHTANYQAKWAKALLASAMR